MRILTVAATLLVAATACYSPSLVDCQFTCSTADTACPGDQVCASGVCRDKNFSAACPTTTIDASTGTDALKDGAVAIDAPINLACEPAPQSCEIISGSGEPCVAHCSANLGWDLAEAACGKNNTAWELAVFDKGIPTFIPQAENWVGLSRTLATAGTPWTWIGSDATVSATDGEWTNNAAHDGKVNTNAAVKLGSLYSDAQTTANPFLCTRIAEAQPAVTQ